MISVMDSTSLKDFEFKRPIRSVIKLEICSFAEVMNRPNRSVKVLNYLKRIHVIVNENYSQILILSRNFRSYRELLLTPLKAIGYCAQGYITIPDPKTL